MALAWRPLDPTVVLLTPSFAGAGIPVSWRALAVEMRAPLFGRTILVTPQEQRLEAPGSGAWLIHGAWRLAEDDGTAWQAEQLTLGLGSTEVSAVGVTVRATPGLWSISAGSVSSPSMPAAMKLHDVQATVAGPPANGQIPFPVIRARWHGAGLAGSGQLSWHGGPAFDGAITVSVYEAALGQLVSRGALAAGAAKAMRAVLDVHGAAQPSAPLPLTWRNGELTVAGFPLWRAAIAD